MRSAHATANPESTKDMRTKSIFGLIATFLSIAASGLIVARAETVTPMRDMGLEQLRQQYRLAPGECPNGRTRDGGCITQAQQPAPSPTPAPKSNNNENATGAFVMLGFLLSAYFFPTIIAGFRKHHNAAAIFVLNLFLGWTFLGWIGALIWAATAVRSREGT
jgi:hypothetical protein